MIERMETAPLGRSTARLVLPAPDRDLGALDVAAVRELFKSAGVLLFRYFDVDVERFRAFTKLFASCFVLDMGASKTLGAAGDYVQSIVPAGSPQELHSENARSPGRPDILWFYCRQPAERGGETTICDGVQLWQALGEATKKFFLTRKLKYAGWTPNPVWREGLRLFFLDAVDHASMAGATYRFNADESVTLEYVTSAVVKPRHVAQRAFTNSIVGPYPSTVSMEDGSPIPPAILDEIRRSHAQLTDEIPWRAGDVAMIDNWRFLHGRRGFEDKRREVLSAMVLANF
jgi:alpha-ketoglutarate-dependent taurine dioxygenase